jgi:hypothetical protein
VRATLALLLCACVASGPQPREYTLGRWRVTYRDWAGTSENVCETEPSWLFDELTEVNDFLEQFLHSSAARGGTWSDDDAPMLQQAVKTLSPLVEAHARNVDALSKCAYADHGVYRDAVERGKKLSAAARDELRGAPEMLKFVQHRQVEERWRQALEPERDAARETCAGDAGRPGSTIFFAWADELKGTTWLFCDGSVVVAPLTGPLELQASSTQWPAAKVHELKARYFELARAFPPGMIRQPP